MVIFMKNDQARDITLDENAMKFFHLRHSIYLRPNEIGRLLKNIDLQQAIYEESLSSCNRCTGKIV